MNKALAHSFMDKFDDLFLFSKEMIDGHGEDNFFCSSSTESAIISVFDGCGGSGARTYPNFKGHTAAYLASRAVSGAIHDWYHNFGDRKWGNSIELVECISDYIQRGLNQCSMRVQSNHRIRGSMVRDFPTTAAIALIQQDENGIKLFVLWAGDSRVYLMDDAGLAQLSEDDVDGEDAMSNLLNDGVITNVLSSDGQYTLHYKELLISKPTAIIAATDGCFGYVPSPMEFEYLILKNLMNSSVPKEFRQKLYTEIDGYASDDFAFGFMSVNFGDFSHLKKYFECRKELLEQKYITTLKKNRNIDLTYQMWNEYRIDYERYLR